MANRIKARLRGVRDYVRYQTAVLSGRVGARFENHYAVWRSRRLQTIIEEYPPRFFAGKTLLEPGAGFGDIGAYFGALGAKVTCLEGRAKNVAGIRRRYPFITAARHDLNHGLPGGEQYDIVVHLGVLYHLANPEKSLREACQRCTHLILETEVADSEDPNFVRQTTEAAFMYDQALDGVGSRPSPANVERVLREEGFAFTRLQDQRSNWELHQYDWPPKNNGQFRSGQRRMWFAKKERK
jgi:Methyltransferase domain